MIYADGIAGFIGPRSRSIGCVMAGEKTYGLYLHKGRTDENGEYKNDGYINQFYYDATISLIDEENGVFVFDNLTKIPVFYCFNGSQ
jgi:hypothetical protein